MIRPGLTTATHSSGLPLPEPMRVSAGFWVTGLSGNSRIHTLPPRLMWRVMAIRAASIWRAEIHPGSRAWMPYSPKSSSVAPLAWPCMRPRWCLRCATLRGINMSLVSRPEVRRLVVVVHPALDLLLLGQQALELRIGLLDEGLVLRGLLDDSLGRAAAPGGGGHDPLAAGRLAAGTRGLAHGHGGLAGDLLFALGLVGQHVALVEPHLHADATGGGAGLAEAVVDVGPQRVAGDPAFAVALGAGHLGAAQAAGALHLDALRPRLLGVLHGPLHGPAEGDPGRQLVGHALGDEGGVQLGLLDLLDVELHLGVAGDLGQPGPQAVGLGPTAPDDDARARGVHVDPQAVTGALDLDPADGGMGQLAHQEVADLPVLDDVVAVLVTVGEPAGLPVGGDTQPEAVRVDFLTHRYSSSDSSSDVSSAGDSSSVSVVSSSASASGSASASSSASGASTAASSSSASTSSTISSVGSPVVGSSSSAAATASPRLRATRARRDSWARRPRRPAGVVPLAIWRASTRAAISVGVGLTRMVRWDIGWRMRVARPRARGRQRLSVGPSSA